jgi:hypothetical protein
MSKCILIGGGKEIAQHGAQILLVLDGQTVIEAVDGAADVAKAASEHSRSHAQGHPAAHARRLRCNAPD